MSARAVAGRGGAGPDPEARPSLVPPWAAGLASLVVPGLGQALARSVWRGLLILCSMVSIAGMMVWRISLLGHLQTTPAARLAKAFELQPLFIMVVGVAAVACWAWNVRDAVRRAREGRGSPALFVLFLATFFALGWQISEIAPARLVTDFPQAMQPLGRVIWPWQAAVVREPVLSVAGASIRVPKSAGPGPAPDTAAPGAPHLVSTPSTGDLSSLDANNQVVPGTTLSLVGTGFRPGLPVELWWVDPLANAFRLRKGGAYLTVQPDSSGTFSVDVTMPYSIGPQEKGRDQPHRIEARQSVGLGPAHVSEALVLVVQRMVETIFMGMMATLFGIILSIPFSFLGARTIMSGSPVTLAIYYATRTVMNVIRAIEPLIWALIAVVWVGLGPFAGIVALTVHSVAALGKLYSEAIEGIDPGPIEAIVATGANRLQTILYAVVPQMVSPFVSFSIYRWDVNVRMSTVIGLVGGGGVGFILVQYIRLLDYRAAGIAVWFIAVTVAVLDYVSAEIRRRFQ
ncbi:MAG TPA: phosphonate ABC transporter, permease protein PhnE [Spirochaetia bacterium]|nr:phosphonate ABC transporter, permease protein PhnE [Spirochaetia bacterium]